MIFEMQYENGAAKEAMIAEWLARPESAAFVQKLYELVENDTSSEVLTVQWVHAGKP